MQCIKRIALALVGLSVSLSLVGCSAEEGLRDGLQDGLASAVAALIEAPVQAWIDATFAG